MLNNTVATGLINLAALIVSGIFLFLLADIVWHGLPKLSGSFLFAAPHDAGRAGGIGPIIAATAWILLVAMVAVAPLALATAVISA